MAKFVANAVVDDVDEVVVQKYRSTEVQTAVMVMDDGGDGREGGRFVMCISSVLLQLIKSIYREQRPLCVEL